MPMVYYEARDFPAEYERLANTAPFLDATWPDIVHAAVTVGRRSWRDVVRYGTRSVFEMIYRAFMVYANLAGAVSGGICKTAANDGLDPSEKSAVSYFLGLTFAKLVAERLLDVHWVMHLDVYAHNLQPISVGEGGARRPDLVGRDAAGRWHVFEAKGRTNAMTNSVLKSAKDQSRALGMIGGVAPHLCVASITHFRRSGLEVCLADPPEIDGESLDLNVSETQFLGDYYKPFVTLVDENETKVVRVDGRTVRVVDVACADIRIGLDEETLALARDGGAVRALSREAAHVEASQQWTLGRDGVFVELGRGTWAPALMELEPPKRT